jgi:hypothetical protein
MNKEIMALQHKNKQLLIENVNMKKQRKSSVRNPPQTNASINNINNNINDENPINQNQNQTQTYQAENLSLTNFPMNLSAGVQVIKSFI